MSINNKRSYTEYTVVQPTTDFAIGFDDFDEGSKDNILVTLNGVLVESLGYAAIRKNESTVSITPAITEGTVRLTRETDIDEPFHKFTAGALFSAKSMDENFQQVRHSQQEVRDGFVFLEYNTNGIVQASKEATLQAKAATVEATASAVRAETAADTAVQAVGSLQGVVDAATTATTNANTATSAANTATSQATAATTSAQNAAQDANTAKQEATTATANANAATVDTLAATGRANEAADVVADLVVGKVRAQDVSVDGTLSQRDINRGLESISDLSTIENPIDGLRVYVKSYHAGYAIGGGYFYYDSSKEEVNDTGLVFDGWVREVKGEGSIRAEWFGVVYDWDDANQTGTDCTAELQAAIDAVIELDKMLFTGSGSIRVTGQLSTNNRPDYRFFNWTAERTTIIFDADVNGLMLQGGAATQTIKGNLTLRRSEQFYNIGGNTFDNTRFGLRVRNCRHDLNIIKVQGFKGAGFIVECTGGNVNGARHRVETTNNDVGMYIFGTRDDMSIIQSELQSSRNFYEGVLVEHGAKMRQWDCVWKGEHNLIDVRENPDYVPITADEQRFGVVINSHINCNFWIYAEETTGTHDIWLAPEGNSRIFSAIRNKDAIIGTNQAYGGRDIYQSVYYSVDKNVEPLRIVGRGITISSTAQQITMPLTNGNDDYGRIKGTASTIGLESSTKKRDIRLHDDYVELGSSTDTTKRVRITDDTISYPHKTVVSKIITLTSSEPSSKILLERFNTVTARSPLQGVLRVVASSRNSGVGYDSGILKYEFIKKYEGIETELSSLSYVHPSSPITSNLLHEVHPDGGAQKAVVCELAYNAGYWGSAMYVHVYYESYNVF